MLCKVCPVIGRVRLCQNSLWHCFWYVKQHANLSRSISCRLCSMFATNTQKWEYPPIDQTSSIPCTRRFVSKFRWQLQQSVLGRHSECSWHGCSYDNLNPFRQLNRCWLPRIHFRFEGRNNCSVQYNFDFCWWLIGRVH